jgi:hypothetical protein
MLSLRLRPIALASAAIATVFLSILGIVCTSRREASAQETNAAADTQVAPSAGTYTMPSGDFAPGPPPGEPRVVIPRGDPIPEVELLRLKRQGQAPTAAPD